MFVLVIVALEITAGSLAATYQQEVAYHCPEKSCPFISTNWINLLVETLGWKGNQILHDDGIEGTLQYTTGSWCFDNIVEFDAGTIDSFSHSIPKYPLSSFLLTHQGKLSCCGVNNFTDFAGTPWQKNKTSGHLLPMSCCKLRGKLIDFQPEDPRCPTSPTDDNSYRMKVTRFLKEKTHFICFFKFLSWPTFHFSFVRDVTIVSWSISTPIWRSLSVLVSDWGLSKSLASFLPFVYVMQLIMTLSSRLNCFQVTSLFHLTNGQHLPAPNHPSHHFEAIYQHYITFKYLQWIL